MILCGGTDASELSAPDPPLPVERPERDAGESCCGYDFGNPGGLSGGLFCTIGASPTAGEALDVGRRGGGSTCTGGGLGSVPMTNCEAGCRNEMLPGDFKRGDESGGGGRRKNEASAIPPNKIPTGKAILTPQLVAAPSFTEEIPRYPSWHSTMRLINSLNRPASSVQSR
jgi:hypothetical protein